MIKRLYLVNGNLTQPLDKEDENIAVDVITAAQLDALNTGDWCYLTLLEGSKLEVIKITRFPSWYWVDRAQDNTNKFNFSTNAKIVYRLTSREIQDAVTGVPLNIYPDGYGAIEVNTGINSWQISYQKIGIQTLGGVSWMNPDGYEIVITDNDGMFGCCNGGLTGAPYAGGVIFYLTSQLYAVFIKESLTPTPNDKRTGQPPSSPIGNFTLFNMPIDMITPQVVLGNFEMYGGSTVLNPYIDSYISTTGSIVNAEMYGGAKNIPPYYDEYIALDGYPLVMELFGNSVDYSNKYIDQYISLYATVLDMSIM